jgi:hypothetical protein
MFQRPRRQTERLPIVLHRTLNTYHRPCRLQSTDTHVSLHVRGKHLILESSNRLLERLMFTLESPVPIDLRSERAVADFPEGFVYAIIPHVVSVKKPKYIGGNGRGRDVDVNDGRGMDFAVVCGPIE